MTGDLEREILDSLAFKLHRATVLVDRAADLFLRAEVGISYSLFLVLTIAGVLEDPSQREIADRLRVSRASVTQRVAELTRRGLVLVRPDAGDRRVLRVGLTPAGGALLAEAWRRLEESGDGVDRDVDAPALIRNLDILIRNAGAFIDAREAGGAP